MQKLVVSRVGKILPRSPGDNDQCRVVNKYWGKKKESRNLTQYQIHSIQIEKNRRKLLKGLPEKGLLEI